MTPQGKEMIDALREKMEGKAEIDGSTLPIRTMDEMEAEYEKLMAQLSKNGLCLGSWLPSLKSQLRILVPGEVCIVLAVTGVGKTALLQNMAMASGLPTLMLSLELPATLCFERFAANATGIACDEIERIYRTGEKVNWRANPKLKNIFVCDQAGLTPEAATDLILAAKAKIGIPPALVLVDYIGLMGGKGVSRYEKTSYVAESLKRIAKDTNTVVVAASQVHRGTEAEPFFQPVSIWDAKDSGSIENSAGVLLGVYRDREEPKNMFIEVLKGTKGGSGLKTKARFDGPTMQIKEIDDRLPEPKKTAYPYQDE